MIKRFIPACILLLHIQAFAQDQGPALLAVRLQSDEKSRQAADELYSALRTDAEERYRLVLQKNDTVTAAQLPDGLNDREELKRIVRAGEDAGASHVLLGRVYSYPEGNAAEVYLVSVAGKKAVYSTGCALSGPGTRTAAAVLSGRIDLFLRKVKIPRPAECAAGRGDSTAHTTVTWEQPEKRRECAVYRSSFERGPFLLLAVTDGTSHDDTGAEPGLQYWYGIGPVVDSVPCEPGKPAAGYRKIERPQGRDLDRLIREKTKPLPVFTDEKERARVASYTAFLKEYYKNPVELSIVLNIIKSYVKKGAVTVLNSFNHHEMNIERREITMVDENYRYAVIFTSSRLVRILYESRLKSVDPEKTKELSDILVRNMTAFGVYRDEISITDADNRTRIVPCYEAVGVSTELHRNYSGWKKATMVFGTGNRELEEKIKQARKKEGQ